MFPMWRQTVAARVSDEGSASRFPSALLRLRSVLSTPSERRAVCDEGQPTVLQTRLWKGDVLAAASRRRHDYRRNGQTQGWQARTQEAQNHTDFSPTKTVQSFVRGQSEAVQKSARSFGQRHGPQRQSGASVVSKSKGKNEKDTKKGETRRRQSVGQGQGQRREDHQTRITFKRTRPLFGLGLVVFFVKPASQSELAIFTRRWVLIHRYFYFLILLREKIIFQNITDIQARASAALTYP